MAAVMEKHVVHPASLIAGPPDILVPVPEGEVLMLMDASRLAGCQKLPDEAPRGLESARVGDHHLPGCLAGLPYQISCALV